MLNSLLHRENHASCVSLLNILVLDNNHGRFEVINATPISLFITMIDGHHVLSNGTLERHVHSRKMFLKNRTNVFPKTRQPLVIQLQWTLMFSPTKCLFNIGNAYVFLSSHEYVSLSQF